MVIFKSNSSLQHMKNRLDLSYQIHIVNHYTLTRGKNLLPNRAAAVYKDSPVLRALENLTGLSNTVQEKQHIVSGSHWTWSCSCGASDQITSLYIRDSYSNLTKTWISSAQGGEGGKE